MIRVKPEVDVMDMLRKAGYSSYRIAQDRIMGQSTLTKLRRHGLPSWGELDTICTLCQCFPWDIIEYIPGSPGDTKTRIDTD